MSELETLRQQIDALDGEIITNVAKRMQLAKKVGEYKIKHNLAVYDKDREDYLEKYYIQLSKEHAIPDSLIRKVFAVIISASRELQEHVK